MSFKYSRYINRVTKHPWAILPEKFEAITELVRERAAGYKPSDEEIAARLGDDVDPREPVKARTDGAVAVIPIHGTIAHRADSFEASSGGTSTEVIGKLLDRVVADDGVKSIVLDVNSPGGSVEGVPELAAKIAAAVKVKPVVAHVNALSASAAYWLSASASEIVITPSGMVGSIGVFLLTVDESEALAKEGVKVTAISAGDYKLEGAPWSPLSEDARAHLQRQVDAVYGQFVSSVAKGRNTTVAEVKKHYGQGRVFDATEAKARGMVDRIATLDDTLARMVGVGRRAGSRLSMAAEELGAASDLTAMVEMTAEEILLANGVTPLARADDMPGTLAPEPPAQSEQDAADRDAEAILAALAE